jgi:hypothetical protein
MRYRLRTLLYRLDTTAAAGGCYMARAGSLCVLWISDRVLHDGYFLRR